MIFGLLVYQGGQVYAQYPETGWYLSDANLMIGEHTPLIWSGTATISGTNSVVAYTPCMQIEYDPDASSSQNKDVCTYNPEYFTLDVLLTKVGAGDSAGVINAKIQFFNESSDTLVTVCLAVKETDTTAVGEVITGSVTGATAIVTSVVVATNPTAGPDSIIYAYMYPGSIFTTSDTVGNGAGGDITAVTYTNTGVIELADSSNIFIASGNYSHTQYGNWRYEVQRRVDQTVQYAIRAFGAAYCRFYFNSSSIADTSTVTWDFRAEH
jgi:hypothetical protein